MKKKVYNDEITNLIKIFAVLSLVFIVFVGITYYMTGKQKLLIPKPQYSSDIQFDEILVGEILNQKISEYYVLAVTEEDVYTVAYDSYLKKLTEKTKIRRYNVKLDRFFNTSSVAKESNFNDNLIFSQSTLLLIKDGKITEVYEGQTKIVEYLAGKIK